MSDSRAPTTGSVGHDNATDERGVNKIVTVCTTDIGGGAEHLAWMLFKALQKRGMESWFLVGDKRTSDPNAMPFFLSPHINYRKYATLAHQLLIGWKKWVDRRLGREDFNFPYSKYLLSITGSRPDIVHCHNLHGGFFDLRVLAEISSQTPVFLTIQDNWLWTGHCTYSFNCTRWKTGCGHCPDLSIPDKVQRDATNYNWRRKREIYSRSRFFVAATSRWLLNQARESILAPAIVQHRVIPCAVDLNIFRKDKSKVELRRHLGIDNASFVIVFSARNAISNPFKDYRTIRNAVLTLAKRYPAHCIQFLSVGESGEEEHIYNVEIRHIPFCRPEELAEYYQAADVYVHAAHCETFGMVIAEAMACGLPIVATAVGGIPEVFADNEHGFLVPGGDSDAMAERLSRFLNDPRLGREMGQRGAASARARFDLELVTDTYLTWYREVLAEYRAA